MRTLILVDIQNDFLPGGNLAVPEGDRIIPVVNRLMQRFKRVIASKDWHPPDHCSFVTQHEGRDVGDTVEVDGLEQILWPEHCVQHSEGAAFPDALETDPIDLVIEKGVEPHIDSYSAFFDNGHRRDTGLDDRLKEAGVKDLFIAGLATNVCVKFTALDALRLGYRTYVVRDAVRGVDLKPGDVGRAVQEMEQAGVEFIESDRVPAERTTG
jgi:nicotinamidase/pyrazinamidase